LIRTYKDFSSVKAEYRLLTPPLGLQQPF
jgi:hypothetical protein